MGCGSHSKPVKQPLGAPAAESKPGPVSEPVSPSTMSDPRSTLPLMDKADAPAVSPSTETPSASKASTQTAAASTGAASESATVEREGARVRVQGEESPEEKSVVYCSRVLCQWFMHHPAPDCSQAELVGPGLACALVSCCKTAALDAAPELEGQLGTVNEVLTGKDLGQTIVSILNRIESRCRTHVRGPSPRS